MNYSKIFKTEGVGCIYIVLMFLCLVTSCKDNVSERRDTSPRELSYVNIIDIGEGKAVKSGTPVLFSSTATEFEIVNVDTADGAVYIEGEISIDKQSGVISMAKDNKLVPGVYILDIKVTNLLGETVFPGVMSLRVLPSSIAGLKYMPFTQEILRGSKSKTTAPVFEGSNPTSFVIVQAEGLDFIINEKTGEISLQENSTIGAGKYKLGVTVKNLVSETVFENVVEINVLTKAYDLKYSPSVYDNIQEGQSMSSSRASVSGSGEFTYSLKDNFKAFNIDPLSGGVSLKKDNALPIGIYKLTVMVKNNYGTQDFVDIITVNIVEKKATLASNLVYSPSSYDVYKEFAFTSALPTVQGSTPITYSIANNNSFVIDEKTGVVSLLKGHDVAIGVYALDIKAVNEKGESQFEKSLTISIIEPVASVVFDDGWDNLNPAKGIKLGNFSPMSVVGNPVQGGNNKWVGQWGLWTVASGISGAVMIPATKENDDWLLSNKIDLTNHVNSEVFITGRLNYGSDVSKLELYVCENINDEFKSSDWKKIDSFKSLKKGLIASDQILDLSVYDGKIIKIAFRHVSLKNDIVTDESEFKRSHYLYNVTVKGLLIE